MLLAACNGNQIRTLQQSAIEQGITYTDFAETILGESAEERLSRTAATLEVDLNYFAIALFGYAEQLDPLTKKFSLFSKPSNTTTRTTTWPSRRRGGPPCAWLPTRASPGLQDVFREARRARFGPVRARRRQARRIGGQQRPP